MTIDVSSSDRPAQSRGGVDSVAAAPHVAASTPTHRSPLRSLNQVLASVDAVRNGRALYVLLCTFAIAGLLLAMAESALAAQQTLWGTLLGGLTLTVAFYGSNAAGLLMMDQAMGRPLRDVAAAVHDAFVSSHRLLLVLTVAVAGAAIVVLSVLVLLAASRLPKIGHWLFALAVPLSVVVLGLTALSMVAVIGPLAAPAVWDGRGVMETVRLLLTQVRQRLVHAALLMGAVSLLTGAVGALVTFVVISGGRVVAALAVVVAGVDVTPPQVMAGLFGYGLRSLGAAGAPAGLTGHAAAALVGGGVVFALALVMPALVYLRGACVVYLALSREPNET